MSNYKTVNIPLDDKIKLDALAEKASENITSYLHLIISYFLETGVDPKTRFKSFTDELATTRKDLSKQIKESRDTYVSFIREMESKKLTVMANSIDAIAVRLLNYLDKEAPTKEELLALQNLISAQARLIPEIPNQQPEKYTIPVKETNMVINPADDNGLVKRAKYLFSSFIEAGHKQTLGSGLVFDEKTVSHYKMLFNQL